MKKKNKVVYQKGPPQKQAKIKKELKKYIESVQKSVTIPQVNHHRKLPRMLLSIFWFFIGFVFASLVVLSIVVIYLHHKYENRVIPGVFADTIYIGDKSGTEVRAIFDDKNDSLNKSTFTFSYGTSVATISAQDLNLGYNSKLIAAQALSVGKSAGMASNVYTIINSYMNGTHLHTSYTYNDQKIKAILDPLQKQIYIAPVDAQFRVENNRVVTFQESSNGKSIDFDEFDAVLQKKIHDAVYSQQPSQITIQIPVKTLTPNLTTEKANSFGIVEPIGTGTSFFGHSIPSRIHNVALAASRVNGILVAPGEEFSFDKYLGDVSALTGYQQAYVIQGGKTVLGDGGGVCQVSTTLFRAILNAGLPITERHAHSYRVGYYEEGGSPPGFDATVFYPSVDLRFKNDTGNYILVQNTIDLDNLQLTYTLYGQKDGRQVSITTPVITNQTPAPPDSYQDDPTLPAGQIKQVDFAAAGATVKFHRTVKKNGQTIIDENYVSNYAPWQAVFLRGTKT